MPMPPVLLHRPQQVPTVYQQPDAIAASIAGTIPIPTDLHQPDPQTPSDQESIRAQKANDFVQLAIRRWRVVDGTETKLRKAHRNDLNFFASDQWPESIKRQRDEEDRPCLTINRLPGFVRQVTAEAREAGQGIEVDPVDSGADKDLAEVYMGLIQHIESNSDADVAYNTAVESQARIGRGWFRIVPEYGSDDSFEQELRIQRIRNPFTVYADPTYQELDGRDIRFLLIVEDLPNDEYDSKWGAESRISLSQFARAGETLTDWMPEGRTRVAEYYCFEPVSKTICRMANGIILEATDLQHPAVIARLQAEQVPLEPVQTRQVKGQQLTWALINGATVLDGNDDKTAGRAMPGRHIPVYPVIGEEIDLDGIVDYRGVVRDAIGSQQMSNFWKTAMTEAVALAPKAPFVAAEGQTEDHPEWGTANTKSHSVLVYRAKVLDGYLVGPPQRNVAEAPIQAMAALSQQAENDIRATAGFSYDVGAHEQRPETSGRAILARQHQGEIGNSHFQAHLSVALRRAGRDLLDLIPHYYDTPRMKRILGRDGQDKAIVIHAGNPEAAQQTAQEHDIPVERIYDLSVGRYDVRVKSGTSFASQRSADRELMGQVLTTSPQLLPIIGDLFFGSMDSPVARRIAKRLEKSLPPQFQEEDGKPKDPNAIPPQVQAKLDQQGQAAQQLIDGLTAKVKELTQQADMKRLELESRERIARIQAETTLAVAEGKATLTSQVALLESKMQQIEHLAELDIQRIQAANIPPPMPLGAGGAVPGPGLPAPQEGPSGPPPAPPSPSPVGSAGNFAGPVPAPPQGQ